MPSKKKRAKQREKQREKGEPNAEKISDSDVLSAHATIAALMERTEEEATVSGLAQ